MASIIKAEIQEAMKVAMKAQDKARLSTIRLMMAAFKQKEVDERIELTDTDVLVILDKMIKQRRDSIQQYQAGNRQDLADQEQFEVSVIQSFMPQPLSDTEILQLIEQAIAQTGAKTMAEMSKVMAVLKPQLQGRAEMGAVSQKIKQKLAL